MFRYAIAVLAVGLFLGPVSADDVKKKSVIGDPAPAFSVKGVDEKGYTLDTFKDKDVLVIVLVSNTGPASMAYEDRLIAFTKNHAGEKSKVGIVAVNVDQGDGNSLEKMKEHVKSKKGFNFTYCLDDKQKIAKDLGATMTPEVFVFNKDRKLVYRGAMDDATQNPKANYLEAAVVETLKGEKVKTQETKPHGDELKFKKD